MFAPTTSPRIFATALGVDFCEALIEGLDRRLAGQGPEALARVQVYVNTARTQRRLKALYSERAASFLPQIRLVTNLANRPDMAEIPPAQSALKLRLQLSRLVGALLNNEPGLAPRSSLYGLSDSLADLMAEMHEERVDPSAISGLDVGDHAQHWQRSQTFLSIVTPYFSAEADALPIEARQTAVIDRLIQLWRTAPPQHPIIIAGSTGSRGPTARLMQAVARLPQGAVILPGYDFEMPDPIWDRLFEAEPGGLGAEDHPQYRLGKVLLDAGMAPGTAQNWSEIVPKNPARNQLISLALRPAPVTDQWLTDGPALQGVAEAAAGMTLLEAPTPQAEATAIALRLRQAADEGIRAALISPDRALTRRVAAVLDRWGIEPDDSGGQPLSLSASGLFLRHVAEAGAAQMTAEALLVLLKHPLCHSGRDDRGQHLLRTRDLELQLLRGKTAFPARADLVDWAAKRKNDDGAVSWAAWVSNAALNLYNPYERPLAEHVESLRIVAEHLASGPNAEGAGTLWQRKEGQTCTDVITALELDAGEAGEMRAAEFRDFLAALLTEYEARDPIRPHPRIMFWGTLEARVQGADLVILSGLSEGVWPKAPGADPWLNRRMRAQAGLRVPDRVIGLSAHDFQQSIAGADVWLTRSARDAEAETVPSRWLNRITNLMLGASDETRIALEAMRARGKHWLDMADKLAEPKTQIPPAKRPAPCPPVHLRPNSLSVTQIEKLIRDPYAIYVSKTLRIRPLTPLRQSADAPLRGTVIHDLLHKFVAETFEKLPPDADALLIQLSEDGLQTQVPWPAVRRLWRARIAKIAPWFVQGEAARRALACPRFLEAKGQARFDAQDFTLSGTADRIDLTPEGRAVIYDYKTGSVPSKDQEKSFNKQLWLEALMARKGAFGGEIETDQITYIGLGSGGKESSHPVSAEELDEIEAGLLKLIAHYRQPETGFGSRRAMFKLSYGGDYDHLARFGEWDETQAPEVQEVGHDL